MNNDVMEKDWFNFQEKIAEHFRSLGVQAETNKTIRGDARRDNFCIFLR